MTKFKKILEDIKRRNLILRENKVPKNFSSKEMPGQADGVYHECIQSVKAEAKVVLLLSKAHNARKKNHASEKKTLDK